MSSQFVSLPLTGGGSGGVTSINSETGDVILVAGSGITVTPSGQNITIASTGLTSSTTLSIMEDFCTGDYQGSGYIASENTWRSIQSGSPAFTCNGSTIPSTAAHPGVLQITVSASGTDVGSIATGSFNNNPNAFMMPGAGQIQIDVGFSIPTLSNGTNNAEFVFGLMDSAPNSPQNNSIWVEYEIGTSVNWICNTTASSTTTATTSTTAVTAGWHHGTIIINDAATSVAFYMDGILLATNTTHIPTVAIQFLAGYRKTFGAGALSVGIDYIQIQKTFTTPR